MAKNSAITCVYKKIHNGKTEWIDQDVFDVASSDGRLFQIRKNFGVDDEIDISLETYLINIDKL